jgi:hypothetical protein
MSKKISHTGTTAILRGETPLMFDASATHPLLREIIQYLCRAKSMDKITASIYKRNYIKFLNSVMVPHTEEPVIQNFSTFKKNVGGYLKLWLKPRWSSDRLESFLDRDTEFSIVNGCWVHSSSAVILRNSEANMICCLMMDTTWSIMRQYVTAIMVAVSNNTAVPLAFAFGRVEDSGLYQMFFSIFYEIFQIDLSDYILETDQGSALVKFARDHAFRQRFCLRHFIANLKDHTFAVFVYHLIKTRTETEFRTLAEGQRPQLHQLIQGMGDDGLSRANKEFKKAGLLVQYEPGEDRPTVTVFDASRWLQVCCITKINECIPMTTNCLESINGHRNAATPRRNCFWSAMTRIAGMVGQSIGNFPTSVRNNFNNTTRKAVSLAQSIDPNEMDAQCIYYRTSTAPERCDCGLFNYFTGMFHRVTPCCHLIHKGVARPRMCDPPVLHHEPDPLDFVLKIEKTLPSRAEEPSFERRNSLVAMAAHSIKHLSRTGVKLDEIMSWVNQNMPQQGDVTTFVQNIPIEVLIFIERGVMHYGDANLDD